MAQEEFRDKIATVDAQGKRIWIFPKKPSGQFYSKRKILSYLLLLLLFAIPFIKIDGEPFLLFNIIERKFSIFGQVFWPQDLYLFALSMLVMILFIVVFTVIFGRLFCGWICPQTIFMEMVFRRIEYWIEGDYKAQKKLAKSPWNREKIWKRSLKYTLFFGLSFIIANTFLAYIIGYEQVWDIATTPPAQHIVGFIAILIFTFIFFMVFLKLREQVCTTICPYGRLQGVLLDSKSLNVIYDYKRGEKRAKFNKKVDRKEAGQGDCIDCNQCVNVCPTGIDIRNGIQLECINCTACIDACDFMMEKTNQPKGLIRYDSEDGVAKKENFRFTPRVIAYTIVLVGLLGLLTTLLMLRSDFEVTLLRTRGTLFEQNDAGEIYNIYDINIINKTNKDLPVHFEIIDHEGRIEMVGNDITLKARDAAKSKFIIYIEPKDLTSLKTDLKIGIYEGEELVETVKTTFIAPRI
ncbi:cytochrome c oxidase accessory protein CcoG [Lishizhenia sp.]|uniref:cytochrome c oxidase accessory protein CcoG n=1 Tax=Lishizhenia sp. TaxID=2497594 RepID=UPI00299EBA70|nr:cytochrome c oxidase accessory protein CcoG [Lishizhenia sp.]MDX1444922.1 cytochrome c oxidase accessory protein CcoG [Lishizhenia sp.]